MKKSLTLLLLTFLTLNCYSQISFEKGYFINNSNDKIECLIKNLDWKNNPTNFEYKLSDNKDIKIADIESVKEFGVYNNSKYLRSTVLIDKSSKDINNLSKNRNPEFNEEKLFLKVLLEGKASLYLYEDRNLKKYFYKKENSNIEQLIYKSYLVEENKFDGYNKIKQNNRYKQQLSKDLTCTTIKSTKFKNLKYKKKNLLLLFKEYNNCNNTGFVSFDKKEKKDLFNLTFRPRFRNSSLKIQNSASDYLDTDLGNKKSFGFGIEAEFIFPFNKNKWAFLIEPTYQNYKNEKTSNVNNVSDGKLITEVDYTSIEIPLGIRHYMFINEDSKVFINASFIFDLSKKTLIEFKRADESNLESLEILTGNNLAFGIGYKYKDKYSLEMRSQTSRNILGGYTSWGSNYKTYSIILGYSIF